MTTRPHPKQLATGTPEDGYTVQYSAGDSIWIPTTNSVFGRTGDVVATTDDYSASQIGNDSSVSGEQVSDALEYLDGYVSSVADDVAGISTMSVSGDLSGNLPNPTVTDLSITSEEEGSVLYFDGSNWVQLPPGTDGYILTTHGNNPPTWEEAASGPGGSASIVVMTTPGTTNVTIPTNATILRITCGGGGGGGDGGYAYTDYPGGNGGVGGNLSRVTLDAAALRAINSSISVTVGAGGAGGIGGEEPSSADPGGDSSVSINGILLVKAGGGAYYQLNPEFVPPGPGEIFGSFGGGSDGDGGHPPYNDPVRTLSWAWAGAGGGGGGPSYDGVLTGGTGGLAGSQWSDATPAAGGAAGAAGTSGGSAITYGSFVGRGGGGGGGSITGNAGNGGDGQTPGGGGGGGGSCPDGYTAGNGGDGGDGLVVLEWI